MLRQLLFCQLFVLTGAGLLCGPLSADEGDLFSKQVAPLIQKHCLKCHHEDDAKGDVSLSSREGLMESGAVDLDHPEESYLLELVTPHEGKATMPKDSPPLSAEEIATLRGWISQGAIWPGGVKLEVTFQVDRDWWSLRPLLSPGLPDLATQNPVDYFIDQKLQEKGLSPAGQADPHVLIRRITYDLTGLPPLPADVDEFLKQYSADPDRAWTTLVDRLLASPAFGEKWGQHWLDLARYAESHGYDKDKPRENSWPYRDYVIRSLNDDKPYARFVQEQVAGDALFPGESDGIVALGFLAAGPWDFIGHAEVGEGKLDGRIAKHLDRDEMVSAVFNVFMSTTVQCAQCHHHKFDPIRMEDYYRLHAVFAAVDRADRVYDLSPEVEAQRESLTRLIQQDQEQLDALQKEIADAGGPGLQEVNNQIADFEKKLQVVKSPEYGYHSQISGTEKTEKWVEVDLGGIQQLSSVVLHACHDEFAGIGAGFGFPLRYRIDVIDETGTLHVVADRTESDQQNPGLAPVVIEAGGIQGRKLRITATKLVERQRDYIFALAELEVLDESGRNLAVGRPVEALDSIEAPVRWGKSNLTDGRFPTYNDPELAETLASLKAERAGILARVETPERVERREKIRDSLKKQRDDLAALPAGKLVYSAATRFKSQGNFRPTEGKVREIRLLRRGDLRVPGDVMKPGAPPLWEQVTPVFFDDAEWSEQEGRAELARYLTDRENPLVWRSIANRVWQWTLGQPLVRTPNDFGRGGMTPSHPELLDYLASRLRDDPEQSLKSLIRLIVTSNTYRRASQHDDRNANIDLENAYLWRGQRRRLTAEEFRDTILFVSGRLNREPGGPSFKDFVVEKPEHSPHYEYDLFDPADASSHRRTIYRFVVRSQPQPMLTTLDCADPSISVPQRDESTTALQALTEWNHRFVEVMSRSFADRLEKEAPESLGARIDLAFRLTLGRSPGQQERKILREYLQQHGTASFSRVVLNLSAFQYVD